MSVSNPTVIAAADHFVKFLNSYTEDHRDICSKLQCSNILWAAKLTPIKGTQE